MKKFISVITLLFITAAWARPAFAAMPDEAQVAFDAALADKESQTCELLDDEVKTTSPTLNDVITVKGIMYSKQSEQQLLTAEDTGLYYVYQVAANTEKNKTFNLLTCLYRHEGKYLVQSGEFDTLILQAMEDEAVKGMTCDKMLVYKDAAFLIWEGENTTLYYPTTQRAQKISKEACGYDVVAAGLNDLESVNTQGFFTAENIKNLGIAVIAVGVGLFVWQYVKAKRR